MQKGRAVMNGLRRFIVGLFGLAIAVVTSVLVLTHGWGLEPRSWLWIIGGSLCGHTLAQLIFAIAREE